MGIFNISYSVSFTFEKKKNIHEWVFSHKDHHSDTRKDTSNQREGKVEADHTNLQIPCFGIQGQHKEPEQTQKLLFHIPNFFFIREHWKLKVSTEFKYP